MLTFAQCPLQEDQDLKEREQRMCSLSNTELCPDLLMSTSEASKSSEISAGRQQISQWDGRKGDGQLELSCVLGVHMPIG
jgi:hypothetical protein